MRDTLAIKQLLTEFEVRMGSLLDKKVSVIIHDPLMPNQENYYRITSRVCDFFNVPITEVFTASRKYPMPDIRFISMYLILQKTRATLLETSNFFLRHHTTAIHARDIIKGRIKIKDEVTIAAIEYTNKKLYEA